MSSRSAFQSALRAVRRLSSGFRVHSVRGGAHFWPTLALVGALGFVGGASACSARSRIFDPDEVDAGGVTVDFSSDASPSSCSGDLRRCSRDLHSLVDDCTGAVVMECPSDQGCANGKCVPACESAEENSGTIGCSFWTTPSAGERFEESRGGCFAMFVANSWNSPVQLRVSYGDEAIDFSEATYLPRANGDQLEYEPLNGPLPPGELAVIFLSHDLTQNDAVSFVGCPRAPGRKTVSLPMRSDKTKAFQLTTDRPVSAYSMFPYGGAKSYVPTATLLIPTSAWGNYYLIIDAWPGQERVRIGTTRAALQILAADDDTHVRIGAELNLPPGVASSVLQDRTEVTLSKGELLHVIQPKELTGAPIEADKPIAVFGGAECLNIPGDMGACESAQQQIPPIRAWGTEYAAVRYPNRLAVYDPGMSNVTEELVPWRIVGAVDGTVLKYDPAPPAGAPEKLSQGQDAMFWSNTPFVVKSQDAEHPFYLAGYMTGCEFVPELTVRNFPGDPEFVNVIPAQQYLDKYVFFTDMSYEYTSLVVVRRDEGRGFQDVRLDCAGLIADWRPIGKEGRFEYAYINMVRGFKPQSFPAGECTNGAHEMQGDGPFTVTVWGFGRASSYAYPAGAGVRTLSATQVSVK